MLGFEISNGKIALGCQISGTHPQRLPDKKESPLPASPRGQAQSPDCSELQANADRSSMRFAASHQPRRDLLCASLPRLAPGTSATAAPPHRRALRALETRLGELRQTAQASRTRPSPARKILAPS